MESPIRKSVFYNSHASFEGWFVLVSCVSKVKAFMMCIGVSFSFSWATVTKYHRNLFLTVLEAGKCQDQGASKAGFILRSLFVVCRQLPSCSVLTWPLCTWLGRERECTNSLIPLLLRALIASGKSLTLITSFNPDYLPQSPVSKYHQIWRLALQHTNLWRDINLQSVTVSIAEKVESFSIESVCREKNKRSSWQ